MENRPYSIVSAAGMQEKGHKKGGPARAAKKRTDCRKKKPAVENRAAG
jgi:hypothetical protein